MSKKYVSDFVKKMRELSARIHPTWLWISTDPRTNKSQTYIKKVHGDLT